MQEFEHETASLRTRTALLLATILTARKLLARHENSARNKSLTMSDYVRALEQQIDRLCRTLSDVQQ